jgi:L-threonylcarbamoyladenylate synthase
VHRHCVNAAAADPVIIEAAASELRRGGIVAYPTDTLYGLAIDPRNQAAVARLFAVKGRAAASAIPLSAADAVMAERAAARGFGPLEHRLASAFWPGPLTIVVPASPAMSAALAPGGTLGVRVPAHAVARALSTTFGHCITATSANLSGAPPCVTADDVESSLHQHLDFLLDGGPAPGGPPSTIVELVDGRPVLHRAGAIAWERVLEFVG